MAPAPVAFEKFNYLNEKRESRRHIERVISDAIDAAIGCAAAPAQKTICI